MLRNFVRLSIRSIHSSTLLKVENLTSTTKCRYFSRWVSRKHVAIVNEDELFDDNEDDGTKRNKIKSFKKRASRAHVKKLKEKVEDSDKKKNQQAVTKEPIYKALKEDDKLISSLMISIKTKKKRKENCQMMVEGFRLIQDAIQGGAIPRIIFFSRLSDILQLSLPKEVQLYKIPYRTIQLWSDLTTSPGILGIFYIPDVANIKPTNNAIPLTIICDNIREPGNLGSIVRIAAAVGCEKLIVMKGCVDLWEPKVLRGAVGAHFRIPIHTSVSWKDVPMLISNESKIYLADNNLIYNNVSKDNPVNSESNVTDEADWTDTEDVDTDNENSNKNDEISSTIKSRKSPVEIKKRARQIISQFPIVPYHELNFAETEMVLITGGETEGISLQACNLLGKRNCTRVNISLMNNIESLNAASAISIIAFEMRKQFITRTISNE